MTIILVTLLGVIGYGQSRPRYVKPTGSSKPVVVAERARIFSATAYCLKGKMANGQKVHQGAIAADPRVLRRNTVVTIVGRGTYVVKDTGGAIKGNRVDLWMPSCKAARNFGRRKVILIVNGNFK